MTRAPAYIAFAHHDTVIVGTPDYVNEAISDTAGHLGIIEPIVKELPGQLNDNNELLQNIESITESTLLISALKTSGAKSIVENMNYPSANAPFNFVPGSPSIYSIVDISENDQYVIMFLPVRLADDTKPLGPGYIYPRIRNLVLPPNFDGSQGYVGLPAGSINDVAQPASRKKIEKLPHLPNAHYVVEVNI